MYITVLVLRNQQLNFATEIAKVCRVVLLIRRKIFIN